MVRQRLPREDDVEADVRGLRARMEGGLLSERDSRRWARAADLVLTGERPRALTRLLFVFTVFSFVNLLAGPTHRDLMVRAAFIVFPVTVIVAAFTLYRPYSAEEIETALRSLALGSDPTALRALMAYFARQTWSPEETARLTARHLPMARQAVERGRGAPPKALARWIGALQVGGVVSEDLDEIARRIDAPQP